MGVADLPLSTLARWIFVTRYCSYVTWRRTTRSVGSPPSCLCGRSGPIFDLCGWRTTCKLGQRVSSLQFGL
eukprot:9742397-Lingulodinium_polyedra.AAC.1